MSKRPSHWRYEPDALDAFWDAIASAGRLGETMPPRVFTVSVTTTILSTTFVTVPFERGSSGTATSVAESTGEGLSSVSTTVTSMSISSPWSTRSSPTTTSLDTVLPPIVTASTQVILPPIASASPSSTSSGSSAANETSSSMIGMDSQSSSQKKAVVGGLSGTIAGLIFIGVIICLILRVRRKRRHPPPKDEAMSEKGSIQPRPIFFRTWTGLTIAGRPPTSQQQRPQSTATASVTVDEDHRIIRMNTRHWPRPFAPGAGEGYRDSVPHGQLTVMNPDVSSRPITPRRSTDTPSSFLKKQRSALTGLVFGAPRSSQSMHHPHPQPSEQKDLPTITIVDPTLSRECIAPYARTPSFRSYPSIRTLPVVRQEPPEDPFVTPDIDTSHQLGHDQQQQQPPPQHQHPPIRPRRPSLTSLQTTASRTWSHFLHPFRHNTTTQPIQNVRGASHFSVSTSNSNSNSSYRRSDPFDLSVRGGGSVALASPRMGSEFARRGSANPGWILYEGT